MEGSHGGMFSGQPPGPPLSRPWLPGQASLLQAAPRALRPSNSTLVDELESSSLEACFASLVSQDYVNGTDQEKFELVLINVSSFWTLQDRQNVFSYKKRLQLSVQKPDQVIKEDVSEPRSELQWKDALVQQLLTKLRHWQQVLEDINMQDKKPAETPQGPLAYLEQASAIPAPLKQT